MDNDKSPTVYDPNDKTGGIGRPLWSEADEKNMMGKILGEGYTEESLAPKSELEMLKEKVEELNRKFNTNSPLQSSVEATTSAPSQDASAVPPVDVKPGDVTLGYKDKAEVMAELTKRGIPFDARQTKAKLEALLTN